MEALMKVLKLPNVVMNRWIYKLSGGEERPVFFDPAEVNQHLKLLQYNWSVIREELEGILPDQASIPEYHKLDKNQTDISKGENVQRLGRFLCCMRWEKRSKKTGTDVHKRRHSWIRFPTSSRPFFRYSHLEKVFPPMMVLISAT